MDAPTVFFDIGGTLIDSPDIFEAITRRLVDRWPDRQTYDLAVKTYEGLVINARNDDNPYPFKSICDFHTMALALLAEQHGHRDVSLEASDIAVDVYGRLSILFPETKPVLEKLLDCGATMIIASDNDSVILAEQMSKHDLGKYFTDCYISETVKAYKPTAKFVTSLRKYVPAKAFDCYFVGDAPFDVECGNHLGIKSVLVDRKKSKPKANADFVIHDLRELLAILGLS